VATDPASCGMVLGAGATISPQGGVETGGGAATGVDRSQVGAGSGLLAASVVLLTVGTRRRRLRGGSA